MAGGKPRIKQNMKLPNLTSKVWKKRLGDLEQRIQAPEFHNVLRDLIHFTGLTKAEVLFRIYNDHVTPSKLKTARGWYNVEYDFHLPKSKHELVWFYCAAQSYLFSNSRRAEWEALEHVQSGPVLDFGGGIGQNVIGLAKRGYKVSYFEIGIIQREFVRFRASKHGLKINVINPVSHARLNLLGDPNWKGEFYSTILLQHVLEHIPKYQHTLAHLIAQLKPGGLIIEHSPFMQRQTAKMHFNEVVPLKKVMEQNGMVCIVPSPKKYREPQVWEKKSI
jgi:2-polyprenyl-3-methyl-5-hydroxy-6-metoxy-1,4-benzoquinol methylase